jgi:hypothetical protein
MARSIMVTIISIGATGIAMTDTRIVMNTIETTIAMTTKSN